MKFSQDPVNNTQAPGRPDIGTYMFNMNGQPIFQFSVDQDANYRLEKIIDPALYEIFPKSKFRPFLPATAYNMHPDHGMFGKLLGVETMSEYVGETGIKCLSGINIYPLDGKLAKQFAACCPIPDTRAQSLSQLSDEYRQFTGVYTGPIGLAGTQEFDDVLRSQWVGRFNNRFSGKQTKMPGCLRGKVLSPAINGLPFTHFIKYPSVAGRESDALLEWMGLRMAEATGLKTTKFSLIDQGNQLPPALAVERFDIPRNGRELENAWTLMQDFYGILGEDPENDTRERQPYLFRYDELLEGWIKFCQEKDPKNVRKNTEAFLKRLISAWVGNDADLHAKNFSALIKIDPKTKKIAAVEFAPAYDACLSTLSGLDGEPMFYNLTQRKGQHFESKPSRTLNMNDWMAFFKSKRISVDGKPFCIFETEAEAQTFLRETASAAAYSAVESCLQLPKFIKNLDDAAILKLDVQQIAAIAIKRASSIGADVPDVKFDNNLSGLIKKGGAKTRRDAVTKGLASVYAEACKKVAAHTLSLTLKGPLRHVGGGALHSKIAAYGPPKS